MERKEIFQEVNINGHVATNRIIRSATNDHLGNPDGTVSEAQIEMYRDLASNEVGTIITGHMSVSPDLDYRADEMQLCIGEDKYVSGLRQIPTIIHNYSALAIAQISFAGAKGLHPTDFNSYSTEEIELIEDWFVKAALRAKEAGFDGVQIHMAHGYLLSSMVNPDLNHRIDKFGGSVDNLIRLPKDIVEHIRKYCREDFITMVKMNAHNTVSGIDDYPLLSRYTEILMKAGVDLVEISGIDFTQKNRNDSLYYLDAVKYLRENVPGVVLSLVGGIYSKETIEKALETTDFASLARPLLTQPDFISRLHQEEIMKSRCIRCNKCFSIFKTKFERCIFGPVLPKLESSFGHIESTL